MDKMSMIGKWVYINKLRTQYTVQDECSLGFRDFIPHWIGLIEDVEETPEGILFYVKFNRNGKDYKTHVLVSKEV